jgi:hypothetical protein
VVAYTQKLSRRRLMNKQDLKLKDITNLKKTISKEFTLFSYIDFIARYLKLPLDFWIGFSELLMPEFIEVDGMVVIDELFKEKIKDYQKYLKESMPIKDIEYWINLICVDSSLSYLSKTGNYDPHAERYFADKVKKAWEIKLKNDFPDKSFTVKIIDDKEFGDLLVTFFQA